MTGRIYNILHPDGWLDPDAWDVLADALEADGDPRCVDLRERAAITREVDANPHRWASTAGRLICLQQALFEPMATRAHVSGYDTDGAHLDIREGGFMEPPVVTRTIPYGHPDWSVAR